MWSTSRSATSINQDISTYLEISRTVRTWLLFVPQPLVGQMLLRFKGKKNYTLANMEISRTFRTWPLFFPQPLIGQILLRLKGKNYILLSMVPMF